MQELLSEMAERTPKKDKLALLYDELTNQLPADNPDKETLKSQFDDFNQQWLDLSDQLDQSEASLDSAVELASRYEPAHERLYPWIPQSLRKLEGFESLPSNPEAVSQARKEVEVRVHVGSPCLCAYVHVCSNKYRADYNYLLLD